MSQAVLKIPEGLDKIVGKDIESRETREFLAEGLEQRLKLLILFRAVDDILKKSKLADAGFDKLVEEYREGLAKRYGV